MFENWKVGQTGWVRLRNGKVARAKRFCVGHYSIRLEFVCIKTGLLHECVRSLNGESEDHVYTPHDAIAHLPDCTGFDWEEPPEPHQWNVGDWFVVDERHDGDDLWVIGMECYLGIPHRVDCIHANGDLKSSDLWWHPSWCRPCDPPKEDSKGDADFWPFPDYKVGDYVIMPTKPSDPFLQGHSWSSDLDSIIGIPLLVRRVFPAKLEIDLTHGCILVCKSWVQPCDMGSVEYVTNWSWATHG